MHFIHSLFNSKQDEAILETLKSCSNRDTQAMNELKTCDCNEADYADTKYNYEQQGFSNKYFRCLPNGRF